MDEVKLKNFFNSSSRREEKKNYSRPNINRFHSNTFFFRANLKSVLRIVMCVVFFSPHFFDTNIHAHTHTPAGVYVSVREWTSWMCRQMLEFEQSNRPKNKNSAKFQHSFYRCCSKNRRKHFRNDIPNRSIVFYARCFNMNNMQNDWKKNVSIQDSKNSINNNK